MTAAFPNSQLIWAKSNPSAEGEPTFHPLLFHCLDVAAVALLCAHSHPAVREIAQANKVSPGHLAEVLTFLVSLHDVGKANVLFQRKAPELWPGKLDDRYGVLPPALDEGKAWHGAVTAAYLSGSSEIRAHLHRCFPGFDQNALTAVSLVIGGHHGEPIADPVPPLEKVQPANAPFRLAAERIVETLARLLNPPALPDAFARGRKREAFHWLLAIMLPVADWIGSNRFWFPPTCYRMPAEDYWVKAQQRAARAWDESGLKRIAITEPAPNNTLRHLGPAASALTPLQRAAFELNLPDGPLLILIEDATGAGKTEAALALTHRLLARGTAEGFYFGLPTMATANAMYGRLAQNYSAMFTEDAKPSLVLAHGKAHRSTDFARTIAAGADTEDVAAFCSGWIADDRRKALMAQAGAGTIDQALLAALPVKYQSLRLFGLSSKVLILDEVHAYDPFMLKEIETLLTLHAMLGGSAILLSATLPIKTRAGLMKAFDEGRGRKLAAPGCRAYPLLTIRSDEGVTETPVPLAERSARAVRVERVGEIADAEELALTLAKQGAAVAIIRSTVDAAIATYGRLRAAHPDTALFHARLLFEDRDRIERACLQRFGKDGPTEQRRGGIVVATAVIEQSLDLDFDVLITDLAPIDLLIQRAGRLWRHQRGARPVAEPILHVVSPEPRADAGPNWLDDVVKEVNWVYQRPALLWLSADRLFRAGMIVTATLAETAEAPPGHVRALVEGVYAASDADVPRGLQQSKGAEQGRDLGGRSLASQQVLQPSRGYVRDQAWESEARANTRLDEHGAVVIRLARFEGPVLVPLGGAWDLSELRASASFARDIPEAPDAGQLAAFRPPFAKADAGKRCLVLEADGEAWRSSDGAYAYDGLKGLWRPGEA